MKRFIARVLFVPTLIWNMLLGRWLRIRHWWDEVDEHVVIGAFPFAKDVPALHDLGVRAVVNTCEEYGGPVEAYSSRGIEQHRVPTVDFTPPSLDSVRSAVGFMKRHADDGNRIYVHCKAGRGRSATVVLCWLMAHAGLTPEEGQRLLLEKRPHVHKHLVERQVVQDYWSELQSVQSQSEVV